MTREQFKRHDWKAGENVWVITQQYIFGFPFLYRIVKTKVESVNKQISYYENKIINYTSIVLNKKDVFEYSEEELFDGFIGAFSDCHCKFIFLSEKDATSLFNKLRKSEEYNANINRRLDELTSRAESAKKNYRQITKRLKEFKKYFNIND